MREKKQRAAGAALITTALTRMTTTALTRTTHGTVTRLVTDGTAAVARGQMTLGTVPVAIGRLRVLVVVVCFCVKVVVVSGACMGVGG